MNRRAFAVGLLLTAVVGFVVAAPTALAQPPQGGYVPNLDSGGGQGECPHQALRPFCGITCAVVHIGC